MRKLTVAAFVLLLLSGCNFPRAESTPEQILEEGRVTNGTAGIMGVYVHSVYVWLVNPESNEDRAAFEGSMEKFIANLPYAASIHFGAMVPSERAVVDSSYTYGFIVSFHSEGDLNRYATDPAHLVFLAETKSMVDHILIYDSKDLMD